MRYRGDVRECLCVRQRENERENKLNTYLSAFGIKNEAMSRGIVLLLQENFEPERVKREK